MMKHKHLYYKISHLFCWILFISFQFNCNNAGTKKVKDIPPRDSSQEKNASSIISSESLLKDGDLLTRSDDDFESLSLQNFSTKDRTYSHSGMVFRESDTMYVYHIMAGPENPAGILKREIFSSFVNPVNKTGFGIFRYQLTQAEATGLHTLYREYYNEKLPFDKSFNLNNDDSMYCSEIIYKSLKRITNNRIVLPKSSLTNFKPKIAALRAKNVFFKKFEFIGIDDLYINPFCKEIKRVSFR